MQSDSSRWALRRPYPRHRHDEIRHGQVSDHVEGDAALAQAMGLQPGTELIWVCGSTGPGEESIVLDVYRRL